MDIFTNLNFHYPGSPHVVPSQQPQSAPHHVTLRNEESLPLDGRVRSDPNGMMQARPSLDFTPNHGLGLQHRSPPVGPLGMVHLDPTGPTNTRHIHESNNLSDQYVPSSSDRITCTDHRPLDEIFGTIRPTSSRWPQTKAGLTHSSQNGAPHRHSRKPSVITYALPARPQLEGVLHIPLLAVDNQMSGTGLIVNFGCSDWGIGVPVEGMPMSELLHGNVSGLKNPQERVLDGFGLAQLRFNILWPNYPPFAKMISAFGTDCKPITRAQLGYEVSLAFAEFFYHITSQSIRPPQSGPYTISSSSQGSPSPGIQFDQLHLITVRNTSRGEWMAEIRAVSMS